VGDDSGHEWLLRELGIELLPARVESAAATYAKLRPAIEELRRVPLPFLDAWEPSAAISWIENGGVD
jgi:hypothetical protein